MNELTYFRYIYKVYLTSINLQKKLLTAHVKIFCFELKAVIPFF